VRGFVAEILSVAAYLVGAAVALLLYKQGAVFLAAKVAGLPLPEACSFILIFILAFLLTKILGKMLKEGIEAAQLAALDRVLGFFLGIVEGLVAVSVILLVMQAINNIVPTKQLLDSSVFAKTILPVVGPEVAKALAPAGAKSPKLPELPKVQLPESPKLPAAKP
jgi:membrane protein required for colicin V production